jgi:hypothetical protein
MPARLRRRVSRMTRPCSWLEPNHTPVPAFRPAKSFGRYLGQPPIRAHRNPGALQREHACTAVRLHGSKISCLFKPNQSASRARFRRGARGRPRGARLRAPRRAASL